MDSLSEHPPPDRAKPADSDETVRDSPSLEAETLHRKLPHHNETISDMHALMEYLSIQSVEQGGSLEQLHACLDSLAAYDEGEKHRASAACVEATTRLCLVLRTLLCLGITLEPISVRHDAFPMILPPGEYADTSLVPSYASHEDESDDDPDADDTLAHLREAQLPPRDRITTRLRWLEQTVDGSLSVFRAYCVAASHGPPRLRRDYGLGLEHRRKYVRTSLTQLLQQRPSLLMLGSTLEPRALVLQSVHRNPGHTRSPTFARRAFDYALATMRQDAIRTGIEEELPEVTGHETVSGYVSAQFQMGDAAWDEEERLRVLDSLFLSGKLPRPSWNLFRLCFLGHALLVRNPENLFRTPWILFVVDTVMSILTVVAMIAGSWKAPGSRSAVPWMLLQLFVLFDAWESSTNLGSLLPTKQWGVAAIRKRTFWSSARAVIRVPVVHQIRRVLWITSFCTLALNAWMAWGVSPPDSVPTAALQLEHVFFAFTSLLSCLRLVRFFLLFKGVGYIVIVIARAVNRVIYLALLCIFILISFGSAMYAVAAHTPFHPSDNLDEMAQRFQKGLTQSSLTLSHMLLGQPETMLFVDQAINQGIFGVSQTILLNMYSVGTYIVMLNLFIAVISSAYMPEETTMLFHATKTLFQYRYVQLARLEVFPGAVGTLLGVARFAVGNTLARFFGACVLVVTAVPALALGWCTVVLVAVWKAVMYHWGLILYDDRPQSTRESAVFVYFVHIQRARIRAELPMWVRCCVIHGTLLLLSTPLGLVASAVWMAAGPPMIVVRALKRVVQQHAHPEEIV